MWILIIHFPLMFCIFYCLQKLRKNCVISRTTNFKIKFQKVTDEAIRLRLVHNRDLSRKRHNRYLSIKKGRSIILLQTRNTKTYTFCSHVSTRLNPLWTDKFLFYIYVKLSLILETHTGGITQNSNLYWTGLTRYKQLPRI